MFTIYFVSFAYSYPYHFENLNDAIDFAKKKGFDVSIHNLQNYVVATWSIIGGTKIY